MKKQIILIAIIFIGFISFCHSQNKKEKKKILNMEKEYNKTIDDFVKSADDDMLFGNGLNTFFIEKPTSDQDALVSGFKKMRVDKEQQGGWKILSAKNIEIRETNYRAVLYEYKNNQYIVLYREQNENQYYFRIYDIK